MSCGPGKITARKKFVIFTSIGIGVAAIAYLVFVTTNNPALTASIPAILSLAAGPVICVGFGGVIVFMNRFSKNRNSTIDLKKGVSSATHHDVNKTMGTNSKKKQMEKDAIGAGTYALDRSDM